ncbi:MAG: four helix bundle protein [Sphingobacteriia bacterium]|jgi:four helix bundle protein|nr:four helix bundle protein [Paludibacteraceae bacterium]NCA79985.1 four helix bundle protein [Sphingobacteriia bacterium]
MESILTTKSCDFALRIVNLYKHLKDTKNETVMSKQLLRSGTAIGALLSEGQCAESKADFIHKFAIAQKECNETCYWLTLLFRSQFITETEYNSINSDALELMKLLSASIITAKKNK